MSWGLHYLSWLSNTFHNVSFSSFFQFSNKSFLFSAVQNRDGLLIASELSTSSFNCYSPFTPLIAQFSSFWTVTFPFIHKAEFWTFWNASFQARSRLQLNFLISELLHDKIGQVEWHQLDPCPRCLSPLWGHPLTHLWCQVPSGETKKVPSGETQVPKY